MRNIVYKYQFFTFALIMMFFAVQFLLMMSERGMAQAPALIILSASQFLMMLAMVFIEGWEKKITDKNKKNRIIQWSFIIRTLAVGAMFLTQNVYLFAGLFILFQICTSSSYLFEGMIAQWTFENNKNFGGFRAFFSIGIALATFIATGIVNLTGDFNNLLLVAVGMLVLSTIGAFKYPVEAGTATVKALEKSRLPIRFRFLLVLGALTMAMSNAYVAHLNTHYIDVFGLDLSVALTFGAFAMFIASFISEGSAFLFSEKAISKFGAKKIVFMGLLLGLLRWVTVLISPNEFVFTATYLFHGFVFVFIYVGSLAYIKEYAGNDFTDKMVMEFTILQLLIGIGVTQTINIVLENFTYEEAGFMSQGYLAVKGIYIAVSALILLAYYFGYMKPRKAATTNEKLKLQKNS